MSDPAPEEAPLPFSHLLNYTIQAAGYPMLGPIEEIIDLPEHYLAQVKYQGKEVLIPLHEDLILENKAPTKVLVMDLPEGLLD